MSLIQISLINVKFLLPNFQFPMYSISSTLRVGSATSRAHRVRIRSAAHRAHRVRVRSAAHRAHRVRVRSAAHRAHRVRVRSAANRAHRIRILPDRHIIDSISKKIMYLTFSVLRMLK
jgi:hypothetical protein